ncbi:MAG: prepilin-type N-terminal cleavage/methylation domain-containing protein [Deltaproteobacteria bacterium]|nr:prepilin-type N-terminal cleavage/methylation domain-containing protein [Deltaproteobacteria bacterium]
MAFKIFTRNKSAFTLIEIVMVLILIGILGIIGITGLNSAVSSDRAIYERQLESSIRYAQQYSMSHYCFTFVVFTNPPANSTSNASSNSNACSISSSSSGGNSAIEYGGYQICACPSSNSSTNNGNSYAPPVLINNPLSQVTSYFQVAFDYGIKYSVQNSTNVTPTSISGNYFAFNSEGQPGTFGTIRPSDMCVSSNASNAASFTLFNISNNTKNPIYFLQISFGNIPSDSFYIYPNTGLVSSSGSL